MLRSSPRLGSFTGPVGSNPRGIQVRDVEEVCGELLALPNVVGVGIGYKISDGEIVRDADGNPVECYVVSVTAKVPLNELAPEDRVPDRVDGDLTDVIETGPIRIISDLPTETAAVDPQQRIRPVTPGLSIGLNPGVTAGTLGFIVQKAGSAGRFLLSNWHVIAANNTPVADRDVTTITQPGNADGGSPPSDVIANLTEFVPIGSSGGTPPLPPIPSECNIAGATAGVLNGLAQLVGSSTRLRPVLEALDSHEEPPTDNRVDAALGELAVEYDRTTPEIGVVTDTGTPTLGLQVQKFGRTTGYTTGSITQVNATFVVQGYPDGPATFVDQVAITGDAGSFLAGGDSGSGLADMDGRAVGLCFAGSQTIGIANTWPNVASALTINPAES